SLAARLAAQKVNDEIAAEIDRLMAEMDEALNDGGGDAVELNVKYNDLIGRASGNPKLHEMLVDLKDYVRAFSNLSAALPGRTKEALREHQDILGAIRGGEEDLAESFTRIHLEKSRKAYMSRSQV
ncbi:MAG: FCD domain-containing protein, partial [Halomonas sp.]|nr:FCD domain-containing protein [Halomonas sp.]MDX5501925.1 FCD domain-containing protein [Halomonas sp.]